MVARCSGGTLENLFDAVSLFRFPYLHTAVISGTAEEKRAGDHIELW